jgi:hypothetical protein
MLLMYVTISRKSPSRPMHISNLQKVEAGEGRARRCRQPKQDLQQLKVSATSPWLQ